MAEITSIGAPNSGGFQTQGQISWTDLVTTAFSTTVGVLSRVAAAGVDPYTVIVGQTLAGRFRFSAVGRRQMTAALMNLPSYQSIGTMLSFGFGINHLVRVMGRTEEGQLCLALCASLSECYDMDAAAEVFVEMVRTTQAPAELQPSILQWKDLLNASSGILCTSTFPQHAEKLMALHPSIRGLGYEPLQGTGVKLRGCSEPESMAKALLAIGQITRGELASITIIGSADTGWIAAFAEWHFQLLVRVVLGSSGDVLYQNHTEQEDAHILIIFEDSMNQSLNRIETTGRTYRLRDVTEIIQYEIGTDRWGSASVAGRSSWQLVLYSSFGSDFKRLLENMHAVSGAIGCVARIMKAISIPESCFNRRIREDWTYYGSSSYGRGFVAFLTQQFPELGHFRDNMDKEAQFSTTESISKYNAYISVLKIACNCSVCDGSFCAQETYCLVLIVEIIIRMAQLLSTVDMPIQLMPSRLGVEVWYAEQFVLHREFDQERSDIILKQKEELGLSFFALRLGQVKVALYETLKLFCGRSPSSDGSYDATGAISHNGICVYWSCFNKSSKGVMGGRITVTCGQIQLHEKSYHRMVDSDMHSLKLDDNTR